jgi:hypothetical protein
VASPSPQNIKREKVVVAWVAIITLSLIKGNVFFANFQNSQNIKETEKGV